MKYNRQSVKVIVPNIRNTKQNRCIFSWSLSQPKFLHFVFVICDFFGHSKYAPRDGNTAVLFGSSFQYLMSALCFNQAEPESTKPGIFFKVCVKCSPI